MQVGMQLQKKQKQKNSYRPSWLHRTAKTYS